MTEVGSQFLKGKIVIKLRFTGKSFSEAPQYDKRLFFEFLEKYKFRIVFVLTFRTIFVHNMF